MKKVILVLCLVMGCKTTQSSFVKDGIVIDSDDTLTIADGNIHGQSIVISATDLKWKKIPLKFDSGVQPTRAFMARDFLVFYSDNTNNTMYLNKHSPADIRLFPREIGNILAAHVLPNGDILFDDIDKDGAVREVVDRTYPANVGVYRWTPTKPGEKEKVFSVNTAPGWVDNGSNYYGLSINEILPYKDDRILFSIYADGDAGLYMYDPAINHEFLRDLPRVDPGIRLGSAWNLKVTKNDLISFMNFYNSRLLNYQNGRFRNQWAGGKIHNHDGTALFTMDSQNSIITSVDLNDFKNTTIAEVPDFKCSAMSNKGLIALTCKDQKFTLFNTQTGDMSTYTLPVSVDKSYGLEFLSDNWLMLVIRDSASIPKDTLLVSTKSPEKPILLKNMILRTIGENHLIMQISGEPTPAFYLLAPQ